MRPPHKKVEIHCLRRTNGPLKSRMTQFTKWAMKQITGTQKSVYGTDEEIALLWRFKLWFQEKNSFRKTNWKKPPFSSRGEIRIKLNAMSRKILMRLAWAFLYKITFLYIFYIFFYFNVQTPSQAYEYRTPRGRNLAKIKSTIQWGQAGSTYFLGGLAPFLSSPPTRIQTLISIFNACI